MLTGTALTNCSSINHCPLDAATHGDVTAHLQQQYVPVRRQQLLGIQRPGGWQGAAHVHSTSWAYSLVGASFAAAA